MITNKVWSWVMIFWACILGLGAAGAILACQEPTTPVEIQISEPEAISLKDTSFFISLGTDSIRFDYYVAAEGSSKLIVALPGWNHSPHQYLEHSTLLDSARARGFAVLLAHMGKSVYADSIYPETRADYKPLATSTWWINEVWPELEKRGMMDRQTALCLLGYSTGARGALTLAQLDNRPHAVALLSGDYDAYLDTHDPLLVNALGAYEDFPERWKRMHLLGAASYRPSCAVYVAHSNGDQVVPIGHSRTLVRELDLREMGSLEYSFANGGHNWDYWSREIMPALRFFDEHCQ
jgi:hypothetical protein